MSTATSTQTWFVALLALAAVSQTALGGDDGVVVPLIHDTEFEDGFWTAITAQGATGGFSFHAGHSNLDGNTDACRFIEQHSSTGPAAGAVLHTHRQTWTPLIRGPISSLDMSIDVNCFNGGTSNAVGFGLIVIQGGVPFFGPTFTALTASGWRTDLHAEGLTAASFTSSSGGLHPDFGSTAGVTAFGFYSSNGTGNSTPINSTSGADNFIVNVTTTPPPVPQCTPADIGRQGGLLGADGHLDNNDFISFISLFFAQSNAADFGRAGGFLAPDGLFDNNDFIAFIDNFFAGC